MGILGPNPGMERTNKKRGSFKLPRSKGANSAAKRFGSEDEVFLGRKTPKPARRPVRPADPYSKTVPRRPLPARPSDSGLGRIPAIAGPAREEYIKNPKKPKRVGTRKESMGMTKPRPKGQSRKGR